MSEFDYKKAQLELNKRIESGEAPEGSIAVEGYGFGFLWSDPRARYSERKHQTKDVWQDMVKVGDRWFFVHVLHPNMFSQAAHYGQKIFAQRGEADSFDRKRYSLD